MAGGDVAALIKPGAILLVFCHFCDPPKKKFLVIAAIKPYAIGFFINSEPTSLQKKRKDLLDDLVEIAVGDYKKFLKHDSLIDCSQVVSEYEFDELVASVAVDPDARLKGHISEQDAQRIAKVVDESLNIEASNRKIILTNFVKAGLIPAPKLDGKTGQ